ncbi:MAG: alpha/beta fold hydrolase [Chlamydiales bacterium]|nr:alpha/beta fold hydrolase [Chlamydiales bacterium]
MPNNVDLYFTSHGEGEPLVILHGGPGLDSVYLEAGLAPLSERFQLFFYDQRCLGRSGGSPSPQTTTIETSLQDLAKLQNQLNLGPVHLLAHSWGSMLAILYASEFPNNVRSLKLVAPTPITFDGMRDVQTVVLSRFSQEDLQRLSKIATSEPFLFGQVEAVNAFMSLWFKAYVAPDMAAEIAFDLQEHTAKNWARVNALLLRDLKQFDLRDRLANIACPTLIAHGDQDVVAKKHIDEIQHHIADSKVVQFSNCGHFPFWEAPEAFFNTIT